MVLKTKYTLVTSGENEYWEPVVLNPDDID